MNVLTDNVSTYAQGFLGTVELTLYASMLALLLGFLMASFEEFLHAGKLIASNLDYDVPFIPVMMAVSPICIGMCMLLSWFAGWAARREQRSPRTEAVAVVAAGPQTPLTGGGPPTAPQP